jgi:hypothetical protein
MYYEIVHFNVLAFNLDHYKLSKGEFINVRLLFSFIAFLHTFTHSCIT